ncbi:MAG TPA: right-handed parallel beta-helix repeat-containing protein [Phycisphaerae bacterium]|nr:right-handed parallel beta-helix repeat-containing protein [Phycisphaerae bacterium]
MRFAPHLRILAAVLVLLTGSVCLAAPGGGAARDVPVRTVRDFGAVGDGAADDTAALQKAVDSKAGDIFLPRGTYRLTKTVVIDLDKVGPTSIVGTGAATIVMAGPGPALRLVGSHEGTASPATVKPNVWERQRSPLVDGLEIVGAHEAACGIEATGTMQLIVSRTTIRKTLHAIHLVKRNRNVIVSDCHLYENRGVGLYLDDVDLHQINVTGSHISYNGGGGIVVRAGNVRNIQVTGCDIEGNMAADGPPTANVLIDSTGGSHGTGEVAIVGCTIQHTHEAPGSANVRFIGTDSGGVVRGNVTIADNVLSDVQVNVHVAKARGVSIVGNTFWKGYKANLLVENSTAVVVGPNVFDRNPAYQEEKEADTPLVFRRCADATLTGLNINGVRRAPAALAIEDCRRFNVTGCTILDCDNVGLLLKNVSDSRVSGCLIRNDGADAKGWVPLKVTGGRGNQIVDNLLDGRAEIDKAAVRP